MHILTGMLVAGLLRRNHRRSVLPLLRTGPVQTAHAIPGRIRFRVPSLVGATQVAARLESQLRSLDGVQLAQAGAETGSVVVEYREQVLRPELLFAAVVRLLGLDDELRRTPRPVVVRELRAVVSSLDRVVYDRTSGLLDFSSALLILLTAFGVRKLVQHGQGAMPAGSTLIWWGMHQLFGHGED